MRGDSRASTSALLFVGMCGQMSTSMLCQSGGSLLLIIVLREDDTEKQNLTATVSEPKIYKERVIMVRPNCSIVDGQGAPLLHHISRTSVASTLLSSSENIPGSQSDKEIDPEEHQYLRVP